MCWRTEYQVLIFGITISKALTLYGKGLYFWDIWDPKKYIFLNWKVAKGKYSLDEIYDNFWIKILEFYGHFCDRMLNQ